MAVIPHRASFLIDLGPQTARIAGFPATVAETAAQPGRSFAVIGFQILFLPSGDREHSILIGTNRMLDLHFFRSQPLPRSVRQIHLQPLLQNPPRSLRHIHKVNPGAPVPILPHHLAGEPHVRRLSGN